MLRSETYVARIVLALVIVAERIEARLTGQLVKPALREDAARCLDAHHGGATALIRDRHRHVKAGVFQVIIITFTSDAVLVDAVMWQSANRGIITEAPQFVDVISEHLAGSFKIVQESDFSSNELNSPNCHCICGCTRAS